MTANAFHPETDQRRTVQTRRALEKSSGYFYFTGGAASIRSRAQTGVVGGLGLSFR